MTPFTLLFEKRKNTVVSQAYSRFSEIRLTLLRLDKSYIRCGNWKADLAMRVNAYSQQLVSVGFCLFGLLLVLYSIALNRSAAPDSYNETSQLRMNSNQNYVTNTNGVKDINTMEKHELNSLNCPQTKAATETPGKPIWIAGYPGSGFDMVAKLISAITGLTSVDIYRHHSCSEPVREGAAPTGACLTHWPMITKDSPVSVATSTGTFYNPHAIFIIRNPANAIPSFHARWWRAQNQMNVDNVFPEKSDWIEWRDKRFLSHLKSWKVSLIEWQRGMKAAGISGISLYIPYEELIDKKKGPELSAELANKFLAANHPATTTTTRCLWRRIADDEHHPPRKYPPTFTSSQKHSILQELDDLLLLFTTMDPLLASILQGYRDDVSSNLLLDFGEQ